MKTLFRVFTYLRRYPWLASGTLACAILMTVTVIVFPKVTQLAIHDISEGRGDQLTLYTLLALLAFFVQNFANTLRIRLNNIFEQKVIFDLRSDLYAHIQSLPVQWFDNRSTGDVMTRLMEDVTAMERVLIDGIEMGVVAILQIFTVAAMCFFYSAKLALLALTPDPLPHHRGLLVHHHRAQTLSADPSGLLGHERPAARQPLGNSSDQNVRARARGASAV